MPADFPFNLTTNTPEFPATGSETVPGFMLKIVATTSGSLLPAIILELKVVAETVSTVVEKLEAKAKEISVGDPRDNAPAGPVVSESAYNSIKEYIEIGSKMFILIIIFKIICWMFFIVLI